MKMTEVPLPDAVYDQVENLAAQRHLTVPELLRQAAEQMVREPARPPFKPNGGWQFPAARHLGEIRVPAEELRLLANEVAD
jgi:Ribbon-helix-helix protein, copG family